MLSKLITQEIFIDRQMGGVKFGLLFFLPIIIGAIVIMVIRSLVISINVLKPYLDKYHILEV